MNDVSPLSVIVAGIVILHLVWLTTRARAAERRLAALEGRFVDDAPRADA